MTKRKVTFRSTDWNGNDWGRNVVVEKMNVGRIVHSEKCTYAWRFTPNGTGTRCGMATSTFRTLDEFRRAMQPGSTSCAAKDLFPGKRQA